MTLTTLCATATVYSKPRVQFGCYPSNYKRAKTKGKEQASYRYSTARLLIKGYCECD